MSLLHRQTPHSQVPPQLLRLWEKENSLAFDLSWPCWLYWHGRGPQPNFSGLDLSGRDLQEAFLWGANFSKTNLSKTNLSKTNFSYSNLSGTNFSGANLSETNFSGAYRPLDLPPGWKIVSNYLRKK